MRPALSVVFLTTLIGAGQGLFLALFAADAAPRFGMGAVPPARWLAQGSAASVVLAALGLVASFFHLGRPERAWRSAAMWRTSWLSREVIALPTFMALAAAYGVANHLGWGYAFVVGALAAIACLALFACTAMIYACIRFLQEWASPYTLVNFFLLGCASGVLLAAALATVSAPGQMMALAQAGLALTAAALVTRVASLARNANLVHKSSLQSAIGVANPRIRQVSQGFTGSSFNTLEFFHRVPAGRMRSILVSFIVLAFVAPLILVIAALGMRMPALLWVACGTQYAGLVLERWFFLADSSHPQNLYYQRAA